MNNSKIICKSFKKIVNQCGSPVAVYGVGKYARMLGAYFSKDITCFLDRDRVGGFFMSKPVIPLPEIISFNVNTIVIAASANAEMAVYNRVHDFCKEHKIALWGLQSGDLGKIGNLVSTAGLEGLDRKALLWKQIEEHEVISFDIFDTLLMRRTLYPTDIFDIVEHRAASNNLRLLPGFKNYRNQAEVGNSKPYKGLEGIYAELRAMLGISEQESDLLMKLEMEAERDALLPRPSIVEAFNYAKALGKRVLIVSDMYLPSEFLAEILVENNINGYDKLYVSDDCKASKSGDLFHIVRCEYPAKSYLHIGDNPMTDGWGARKHGIDVFLIKSALVMFQESGAEQPFRYIAEFNERLFVGLFLEKAYRDPFSTDDSGRRSIRDMLDVAALFVAPMISSFIIWLVHKVRNKSFDAVLFAARDGYLFKQLYDQLVKTWDLQAMPRSMYLYASRKLCLGISLINMDDLYSLYNKLDTHLPYFIQDVFGIEVFPTDGNRCENNDCEIMHRALVKHKDEILAGSSLCREGYLKYLTYLGAVAQGNYAFFDMCSQGTSQYAIAKTVLPNLFGFYVHRYNSANSSVMGRVETFLPQSSGYMFLNNVFELFLTSPEPSAKKIQEDGEIVFEKEIRTSSEIDELRHVQEEIRKYFGEFVSLADRTQNISSRIGQHILDLYRQEGFPGGKDVFAGRVISDDLMNGVETCLKPRER